jgi:hypothetical protein
MKYLESVFQELVLCHQSNVTNKRILNGSSSSEIGFYFIFYKSSYSIGYIQND